MNIKTIAVFGGSFYKKGSEEYTAAERLGAVLAGEGIKVKTGGYSGVMEAASRGAFNEKGEVEAVIMDGLGSSPNKYVGKWNKTADLFERTKQLIDGTDGFIIFPGKAGTLAELSFLFALKRIGALDPVILIFGTMWKKQIDILLKQGILDSDVMNRTSFHTSVDDMVDYILKLRK